MVARLLLAFALVLPPAAAAQDAQIMLHLLDYVGVHYPEPVEGGRIKNEDEYREVLGFTVQVTEQMKGLAENPAKAALSSQVEVLAQHVRDKAPVAAIAEVSGKLRWEIIGAYKLFLAPDAAPDLGTGARLYQSHCVSCHGAQRHGDGPAGAKLEPAPSDFHDAARMAQRSA